MLSLRSPNMAIMGKLSLRKLAVIFGLLLVCTRVVDAWMPSHSMTSTMRSLTAPNDLRCASSRGARVERNSLCLAASTVDMDEASAKSLGENVNSEPAAEAVTASNTLDLDTTQKVINGIFLAASFGYALYTILNIDHGMTRGWTTTEIATRIPLDNWGNYEESLANKPVFTKTLINVIIYLLGDWLSQTAFCGKNVLDFDISRTLKNGFIGLCFGPLVHEYYQFSDAILPPEDGMLVRLQKIIMDQTIYLSVKCSIYISAVGLLKGDDWPTVKNTVEEKIGGIVLTAWKFWPLVHCITYGLIPARHRILWVNSVDLIWNAILASKAQPAEEPKEIEEANQELLAPASLSVSAEAETSVLQEDHARSEEVSEGNSALLILDNVMLQEAISDMLSPTTDAGGQNMTSTAAGVAV